MRVEGVHILAPGRLPIPKRNFSGPAIVESLNALRVRSYCEYMLRVDRELVSDLGKAGLEDHAPIVSMLVRRPILIVCGAVGLAALFEEVDPEDWIAVLPSTLGDDDVGGRIRGKFGIDRAREGVGLNLAAGLEDASSERHRICCGDVDVVTEARQASRFGVRTVRLCPG